MLKFFRNMRYSPDIQKMVIIAIAFAVTVSFGLGALKLVHAERVRKPVMAELKQVPGVSDVNLSDRDGLTDVEVKLASVPDFRKSYRGIESTLRGILGDRMGRVSVSDRRTAAVEEAFYRMHFSLEEGVATGRFTAMELQIDAIARSASLDRYRVFVEPERVLVQLHKGEGYLYEVVPRSSPGSSSGSNGSEVQGTPGERGDRLW